MQGVVGNRTAGHASSGTRNSGIGILASALGIDRFAADELLGRHGVTEDLSSLAELRKEIAGLEARLSR